MYQLEVQLKKQPHILARDSLVQCWSDLTSLQDCKTCLTKAIVKVLNVMGNGTHLGGEAALGSCIARYETYNFFNSVSASAQDLISGELFVILSRLRTF